MPSTITSDEYPSGSAMVSAKNYMLERKCEELQSMISDYSVKYKEFEIIKQREFLNKEEEYTDKITRLHHQIQMQKMVLHAIQAELKETKGKVPDGHKKSYHSHHKPESSYISGLEQELNIMSHQVNEQTKQIHGLNDENIRWKAQSRNWGNAQSKHTHDSLPSPTVHTPSNTISYGYSSESAMVSVDYIKSAQAKNYMLERKCEKLQIMVSDYNNKYKEFEIIKQREFSKKEEEYTDEIDRLQHQIQIQKMKLHDVRAELRETKAKLNTNDKRSDAKNISRNPPSTVNDSRSQITIHTQQVPPWSLTQLMVSKLSDKQNIPGMEEEVTGYADSRNYNHQIKDRFHSQWIEHEHYIPLWLYRLHPPQRVINMLKLLTSSFFVKPLDSNVYPDINHNTESYINSCPHNQQPHNRQNSSTNKNNNNNNSEKRNSGSTPNRNNNGWSNDKSKGNDDNGDDEKKEDNKRHYNSASDLRYLTKRQLIQIINQKNEIIYRDQIMLQQQKDIISNQYSTIVALQTENQQLRANTNSDAIAITALRSSNQSLTPLLINTMQDANRLQQENQLLLRKFHKMKANKRIMSFFINSCTSNTKSLQPAPSIRTGSSNKINGSPKATAISSMQSSPSSLRKCTCNDLVELIRDHPQFKDKAINKFKNAIIDYIEQNNIDGEILSNTPRKAFSEGLIIHIDNNRKIRGPANKTWHRITKFDFKQNSIASPINNQKTIKSSTNDYKSAVDSHMCKSISLPQELVQILKETDTKAMVTATSTHETDTKKPTPKQIPKPRGQTAFNGLSYEPRQKCRIRKNAFVPRALIENIKSKIGDECKQLNNIECGLNHYKRSCNCDGLYSFLDIEIAAQFHDDQCKFLDDKSKVFDIGFVDKESNEEMYLVIDVTNQSKKAKWMMRDKIYNKTAIVTRNSKIPTKLRDTIAFKAQLSQSMLIKKHLMGPTNFNNLIRKTKWCNIPIFSRIENARRKTLFIKKPEFIKDIKNQLLNSLNLIPILMFKCHSYQIHHLLIIEIDNAINIGISMIYNNEKGAAIVTGIHIDKRLLIRQHQWISLQHMNECKCFDNFNTTINDLAIGNPDDQQNKINALEKAKSKLGEQMKEMKNKLALTCKYLQIFRNSYYENYIDDTSSMSSNDYGFGALDDSSSTSTSNLSLK